jgi:hypothetical protein
MVMVVIAVRWRVFWITYGVIDDDDDCEDGVEQLW